mmetsp:Transcript_23891/g.21733  ORF Transcript_23891/g.21733 Transcript_23891/m.21733 type:complete len:89 (-) Transcript_23891:78-344(-)
MAPKAAKSDKKTVGKVKGEKTKAKRAPSPYIIFCTEKRPEVKAANPEATFGELGKLLGQLWGSLDEKGKAPYVKKSAEHKAALENDEE